MTQEYDRALEILRSGDADQLEALCQEIDGFPNGVDSFLERRWIINAIDVGSGRAVEWMLQKGVNLDFRDEEGYSPLHAVLDRQGPDRLRMLELLLTAGAPINKKGINDWTPAHMAAARDDVAALRLLVQHGADLSIRTEIDHHATPLEEAQHLGRVEAARYLASV
jgi:ankyrin repeat protein